MYSVFNVTQKLEALFTFFILFSFCSLNQIISSDLSLRSLVLYYSSSKMLLNLSSEFFEKTLFILFLAVMCLCCCLRAFSSCSKRAVIFCCSAQASGCSAFSCCRSQALENSGLSRLWLVGLIALQHMESSRTRN